jgi:3-deoxy-D-manno-octulosonate 8-phosphate phosphatase (KDO 8-P phosphatase)
MTNTPSFDEALARAKAVKLAIFDVDGVLTDGRLYMTDAGEEIKAFNSLDGHGLKMLRASGVRLAIITGRTSKLVAVRAEQLQFDRWLQGAQDKLAAYSQLLQEFGLTAEATAYMGDDVVDLPVMRRAGFAATVPGASDLVRSHAHYVTQARGGEGAVREVSELIMSAQGTLDAQLAPYLA